MLAKNHYKFSLIIPCYNESKNIPNLFKEIEVLQKNHNFEVIIVNNGSRDNSKTIIQKQSHKIKNLKLVNIKNNLGFGYGIKMGILKSSSKNICYTHGDMQIKISACLEAYEIYSSFGEKIYVKSKRISRPIFDTMFTFFMSVYYSILFQEKLTDIHSQPNFFKKPKKKIITNAPNDMLIDLYFYILFIKKKINIERFDVIFKKRKFGVGSNETLKKKINYIFYSLIKSYDTLKIINSVTKL
jgi:glycosyltransferase involved in cell wall biosynthesis